MAFFESSGRQTSLHPSVYLDHNGNAPSTQHGGAWCDRELTGIEWADVARSRAWQYNNIDGSSNISNITTSCTAAAAAAAAGARCQSNDSFFRLVSSAVATVHIIGEFRWILK